MIDAAAIEKDAMLLPEPERAELAERLLMSLQSPPDEMRGAWTVEAEDRLRAFHEGRIEAVDGPEAMAELRERFSR